MYAKLGTLLFEVMTGPSELNRANKYLFAEHERIDGKSSLQFLGEGLQEISLSFHFHSRFCTPSAQVDKLRDAAKKAEAMPLVFNTGEYVGDFVIEQIGQEINQTDGSGFVVESTIEVKLREYAKPEEITVITKKKPSTASPSTKKASAANTGTLPAKETVPTSKITRQS